MIKVLLADDHPVMQNALARVLQREDNIQIVAMAHNGRDAVRETVANSPDIAVIDIFMPETDGIEVTKQIRAQCPQTRVLILSGRGDPQLIQRALQAGAKGYILKDFIAHDLIMAIYCLYRDESYFSKPIAEIYMQEKRSS